MNIVHPLLNEECWICKENIIIDIKYCECNGSISYVHQKCLNTWVNISHKTKCDFCNVSYNFDYKLDINKYISKLINPLILLLFLITITTMLFIHNSSLYTTGFFTRVFMCSFSIICSAYFLSIANKLYIPCSVLTIIPYDRVDTIRETHDP